MNEEQLLNFIAVAESTPGPVAINMATYIGYEQAGLLGAIAATVGVVIKFVHNIFDATVRIVYAYGLA